MTLEDLYRRYMDRGDVAALAEVFDSVAPDLGRLAKRLTEDRSLADDLVQEVFLTALERGKAHDHSRPLMPWLIGILVNRARATRRADRRLVDFERLRMQEELAPDARVSLEESQSAIDVAVGELPPTLREVVQARLAGENSTELASRLGVSSGALRARLHRGMQRLRAALPPGLATGFALVFLHSHGLAKVRAQVLSEARRRALVPSASGAVGAIGLGVLLMSKSLAAVVLAIGLGWIALELWKSNALPASLVEVSGVNTEATKALNLGTENSPTEGGKRDPVLARVDAPNSNRDLGSGLTLSPFDPDGKWIEVRMVGSGDPMPGAIVSYLPDIGLGELQRQIQHKRSPFHEIFDADGRHYQCDEEGRVRIGSLASEGLFRARAHEGDVTYSRLVIQERDLRVIAVAPESAFDVRVVNDAGEPMPGVRLVLCAEVKGANASRHVQFVFNSATTDKAGVAHIDNTYRYFGLRQSDAGLTDSALMRLPSNMIFAPQDGMTWSIRIPGYFETVPRAEVDLIATSPEEVELICPEMGRVEVQVTDAEGVDFNSGYLIMSLGEDYFPSTRLANDLLYGDLSVKIGDPVFFEQVQRGRLFNLGTTTISRKLLGESRGLQLQPDQELLRVHLVTAILVPKLTGRALLPTGLPLANVDLGIRGVSDFGAKGAILGEVSTKADGAFAINAPWIETYGLTLTTKEAAIQPEAYSPQGRMFARLDRIRISTDSNVALGDVRFTEEVLLASGRVLDAEGHGISLQVKLEAPIWFDDDGEMVIPPGVRMWTTTSDPDGHFTLFGATNSETLELTLQSEEFVTPEAIEVVPGETNIELRLEQSARFTFQLPGENYELGHVVNLVLGEEGSALRDTRHNTSQGESPYLPPGQYHYELNLETKYGGMDYGNELLLEGDVFLLPGQQLDLGLLEFDKPLHHYEVQLTWPEGMVQQEVRLEAMHMAPDQRGTLRKQGLGQVTYARAGLWHVYATKPVEFITVRARGIEYEFALADGRNEFSLDGR